GSGQLTTKQGKPKRAQSLRGSGQAGVTVAQEPEWAWQGGRGLLESNRPPEVAPFVVFIQTRQSRMADETRAVRTVETGEHRDRVLIDEDNARKGYEQLLQRWGYEVLGVASAEEALAKFSNFQPDTVIADVELPGMNGLDLLKQLGDELLDVPAIIITGKGSEERAVAAIESGAFWYIEKPLKGPVLRALL